MIVNNEFHRVQINENQEMIDGQIIKSSILINVRCDDPDELIHLYREVKTKLNSDTIENTEDKPARKNKKVPSCPECGAPMILRQNGQKGSYFWGCSKYPKCRGTRQHEIGKQIPIGETLEVIEV